MEPTPRKPLQPMPAPESLEPHSIRFQPRDWAALSAAARARGLEPAVFVRRLTMFGFSILQAQVGTEAAVGMLGQVLSGSQGIGRF